jgi:hypothetical protein
MATQLDLSKLSSPYLRGWKEIAVYLKTSVRTVQRWEKLGLPIHRVGPMKVGGVFALASEIDRWMLGSAAARASMDEMEMTKISLPLRRLTEK